MRVLGENDDPLLQPNLKLFQPNRQTVMWSATWPHEVKKLAQDFMSDDAAQVMVGSGKLVANKNITQVVNVCREDEKINK